MWICTSVCDMYPSSRYHTECPHCPKNPQSSICSSLLPTTLQSPATTGLSTVFIVLPFLERPRVGIIRSVAFSDWLLPLNNIHLKVLPVSSWFYSSSLISLALNDISLPGCNTIYLSFHLLKDILFASTFWRL